MAIRKNKVDAREKRQDSRETGAAEYSRYDGGAEDWLDVQTSFMETETDVFLPHVVGRLPDMGQTVPAPVKRERRGVKFVGAAAMLAVAFGLGALSTSGSAIHSSADDVAANDETAAEEELQQDYPIAYSVTDDWPKLPNIEPEPESAYAGYGGSPVTPRFDDVALPARRNDDYGLDLNSRADSFDGLSAPYSSPVAQEYAAPAEDVYAESNAFDAAEPAKTSDGFAGGFADYQFGSAVETAPYAQTEPRRYESDAEFDDDSESASPAPRQTAVLDRGQFLSANQFDESDFNDNADFDGFNSDANQKNFTIDARYMASDEEDGYNNPEDLREDVYAWSKDASSTGSRFQGFGSSWDGGESRFDEVSSESPFPTESEFNAEYVANNYEKESANTTSEAPRAPARSVRW